MKEMGKKIMKDLATKAGCRDAEDTGLNFVVDIRFFSREIMCKGEEDGLLLGRLLKLLKLWVRGIFKHYP